MTLPSTLKGTYVVSWRVISADTHPVQGAFTFSVGAPSAGTGVGSLEQHLLASRHPSRALGFLTGTLRTVILLGVIVAVGGAALLVGWPAGIRLRMVRNAGAGGGGGDGHCQRRGGDRARGPTTPVDTSVTRSGPACCRP